MNYRDVLPKLDLDSSEKVKCFDLEPGQFVARSRRCTMSLIYAKDKDKYKSIVKLRNLFKDCVYIRFNRPGNNKEAYIGESQDFFGRYKKYGDDREKLPNWGVALVFSVQTDPDLEVDKQPFTEEKRKFVEAGLIKSFDGLESGYTLLNDNQYKKGLPKIDACYSDFLNLVIGICVSLIKEFTVYSKCFRTDTYTSNKEIQRQDNLSILIHFRDKWVTDLEHCGRDRWRGMRAKPSQRSFEMAGKYLPGMVKYIADCGGSVTKTEYTCMEMIIKSGKEYGRENLKCDKQTLFEAQDQPYLKFLSLIDTFPNSKVGLTPRGELLSTDPSLYMDFVRLALEEWRWFFVPVREFCRKVYKLVGVPNTRHEAIQEFMYIISHGGVDEYYPYDSVESIAKLVVAFRSLNLTDKGLFCDETDRIIMKRLDSDESKLANEKYDYEEAYEDVYGYGFLEDHTSLINKYKGSNSCQNDFMDSLCEMCSNAKTNSN